MPNVLTTDTGDFLLTNSMSFGRPYILDTHGCIHDGWLVLSPRQANVDHDYFYHLLGSPAIFGQFEKLAAGATVKNLNIDLVKSVAVALPPVDEQKRIAAILDQADDLRRKRKQALDRLNQLGQAIFHEMFGDPAVNPMGWPVVSLGDLVPPGDKINYGVVQPGDEVEIGVPLVRVGDLLSTPDLKTLCQGIAKLLVIDTSLTRGDDNPQLIFESMNSTGKELSQADLVRNFVLMGLEPALQTRLYKDYWRPIELEFGQQAYGEEFDAFMRHYLTLKTGDIPRQNEVYEAFKAHARSSDAADMDTEALVKKIRAFAGYYCAMALGKERCPRLKDAFQDLRELKVEVAYPFLLEVYDDCAKGLLTEDELLEIVRLIEAYVFRRAVCSIPTNSLNKTFATFGKVLRKGTYLESVKAHFLLLPSYRRFPKDEEFRRDFETRDLYKTRIRSYWLRRLENHERKERIVLDEYTIEHIMPQNENLSGAWKADLGAEWQRVQQTWLHTAGNLTLTRYNSEYSDRPFLEKRNIEGGFKESPLRMNAGLGALERWDEDQIRLRAQQLSAKATEVWTIPALEEPKLATYRKAGAVATYTINEHPHLLSSKMRPIFEAFRREVLALDPCVAEEYLKLYVAYKAETNFVDVVPQASALRLSLNMKWADLVDPKGLCIDVSGKGRWGNGDVEIKLSSLDDLPYVIGLVRQSLELQLGNEGEA